MWWSTVLGSFRGCSKDAGQQDLQRMLDAVTLRAFPTQKSFADMQRVSNFKKNRAVGVALCLSRNMNMRKTGNKRLTNTKINIIPAPTK